ncbi:MAG: hypothetical protein ACLSHJ_11920 [Oscillospiraceae bacterium]
MFRALELSEPDAPAVPETSTAEESGEKRERRRRGDADAGAAADAVERAAPKQSRRPPRAAAGKRPEGNAERPADKVGECRRPTERREGEKKSPVPSAERKPAESGEGEKSARRRHHRGGRGRRGGRGGSGGGAPGAAPSAE